MLMVFRSLCTQREIDMDWAFPIVMVLCFAAVTARIFAHFGTTLGLFGPRALTMPEFERTGLLLDHEWTVYCIPEIL